MLCLRRIVRIGGEGKGLFPSSLAFFFEGEEGGEVGRLGLVFFGVG